MPELTGVHIGLLALALVVGVALGWFLRGGRCAREKIAANAGWQEELDAQQSEHDRLAEQNKSLMEQISQYQASHKDYGNRAKELAQSLEEAVARRDELQRQAKDLRQNLDIVATQRDKLHKSLQARDAASSAAALKEKDEKIFRLSRELTSWQSRLPPLVERFQARDREARELGEALERAEERIAELEELTSFDQTRIEAMDADSLPAGGFASNEPDAEAEGAAETSEDAELQGGAAHVDGEETDGGAAPGPADDESDQPADNRHADDEAEAVSAGLAGEAPGDPAQDSAPDAAAAAGNADDLQKIKGIGPSIERTLNELGIRRYQQIADLSEYEIDRVALQLKGFRSRIYRENWIGQARDLLYETTGGRA